ncbi:MAG: GGDEF domain-containing protein [Marinobacter sp.]|nr:GGDEF domain-containing protein [Marinobacter sp.]
MITLSSLLGWLRLDHKIPARWQPAFSRYEQEVAWRTLIAGSAIAFILVLAYHSLLFSQGELSREGRMLELAFRAPILLLSAAVLISSRWLDLRKAAPILVRLLGLSGMLMILGLFSLQLEVGNQPLVRMSNGLLITFFGVTMAALRGVRDWPLLFGLPILAFALYHLFADTSLTTVPAYFFDAAVTMVLGTAIAEVLYQLRRSDFLHRQHLTESATLDPLTSLLNRRAMLPRLEGECERSQRKAAPFTVIIGDLDHFKRINDTYGHNAGDDMLRQVARRMEASVRKQDSVSRWGGEEFLILCPDTDLAGGQQVAEKIRQAIAIPPIVLGAESLTQTISLGVAFYRNGDKPESLLSRADEALYAAKASGRNQVITEDHE